MPVALDRRLASLEQRLRPPPPRQVVLVVGMARSGCQWIPDAFELPGGGRIDRAADEHPDTFRSRVETAALAASSARVVVVAALGGRDVPEGVVHSWSDAHHGS